MTEDQFKPKAKITDTDHTNNLKIYKIDLGFY